MKSCVRPIRSGRHAVGSSPTAQHAYMEANHITFCLPRRPLGGSAWRASETRTDCTDLASRYPALLPLDCQPVVRPPTSLTLPLPLQTAVQADHQEATDRCSGAKREHLHVERGVVASRREGAGACVHVNVWLLLVAPVASGYYLYCVRALQPLKGDGRVCACAHVVPGSSMRGRISGPHEKR